MDIWGNATTINEAKNKQINQQSNGYISYIDKPAVKRSNLQTTKAKSHVKTKLTHNYGLSINPSNDDYQQHIDHAATIDQILRNKEEDLKLRLLNQHPDQINSKITEKSQFIEEEEEEEAIARANKKKQRTTAQRNKKLRHKQVILQQKVLKIEKNKLKQGKRIQSILSEIKKVEKEEKELAEKEYRKINPIPLKLGGIRKNTIKMPNFKLPEEMEQIDGKMRKVLPDHSTIKDTFQRFSDRNLIVERTIAKKPKKI